MYRVIKRDGSVADFTLDKIIQAITKAFVACEKPYSEDVIERIALRVTSAFSSKIQNGCIGVEDIQDSVESVLSESGYYDVAKAYILYRKQRENVRNIEKTNTEYTRVLSRYFTDQQEEATYSVGGLILNNSGALTRNYWLGEIYDEDVVQSYRRKELYVHDLDMFACARAHWSLKELMEKGIVSVNGNICSGPSKHLSTLCSHMVNILGVLQNEWAQEQVFTSFDTYVSAFAKKDGLSYVSLKQNIQTFIYGINVPSRWGSKPPYTLIGFDGEIPEEKRNETVIIAGEKQEFTYGECEKEMHWVQKAFLEVMLEGDYEGKCFRFPVPYFTITDLNDSEIHTLLVRLHEKYGHLHLASSPLHIPSSLGMVSLNLEKLCEETDTEEQFYARLDTLVELAERSLSSKREVMESFLKKGLYPYTQKYLGSFFSLVGAIGLVGVDRVPYAGCLKHIHDNLKKGYVLEEEKNPEAAEYFGVTEKKDYTDVLAYLDREKQRLQYYADWSEVRVHLQENLDTWKEMSVFLKMVHSQYGFENMEWE